MYLCHTTKEKSEAFDLWNSFFPIPHLLHTNIQNTNLYIKSILNLTRKKTAGRKQRHSWIKKKNTFKDSTANCKTEYQICVSNKNKHWPWKLTQSLRPRLSFQNPCHVVLNCNSSSRRSKPLVPLGTNIHMYIIPRIWYTCLHIIKNSKNKSLKNTQKIQM